MLSRWQTKRRSHPAVIFMWAALTVGLLLVHDAVAQDAVPRCNVDGNRFASHATSIGAWAGLEYDVQYKMNLCAGQSTTGTATVVLNGDRQEATSRSAALSFDGVGVVHFAVAGAATGPQTFTSRLCWADGRCATLCAAAAMGSVGDCTVEETVMPTLVATLWLLPAVICGCVLAAFYVKRRAEEREAVLRQRDLDLAASRAARHDDELRPMTTATADSSPTRSDEGPPRDSAVRDRDAADSDGDAHTVSVDVAPQPRQADERDNIDVVVEADEGSPAGQCAAWETSQDTVCDSAGGASHAGPSNWGEPSANEDDVDMASHESEGGSTRDGRAFAEEENACKEAEASALAAVKADAAADEAVRAGKEQLRRDEAAARDALEREEEDERRSLEGQSEADAAAIHRAEEAAAVAAAAEKFARDVAVLEEEERRDRSDVDAQEEAERGQLEDDCGNGAEAIREAEEAAAAPRLAEGISDLESDEAGARDGVERQEEEEREGLAHDCEDGASAIAADEAAAAAAEQLARDVVDLEDRERQGRIDVEGLADEKRDQLVRQCQDGATAIQAEEAATAAAKQLAEGLAAVEEAEAVDRDKIATEEDHVRDRLLGSCSSGAAFIREAALAAAVEAVQDDESEGRRRIAQAEGDAHQQLSTDEASDAKAAREVAAAVALAACREEAAAEREAIAAAADAARMLFPCETEELHERAMIAGDEEARQRGMSRDEKRGRERASAAEEAQRAAVQRALHDLPRREAAVRDDLEKEEAAARSVLQSRRNAAQRRVAKAAAAKEQLAACAEEEAAGRTNLEDEEEGARDDLQREHNKVKRSNAMRDVLDATKSYNDEYKARMQKVLEEEEEEEEEEPPMPFIGFSLTEDVVKGVLVVDGLYKDGPAYQTGIRIGDTLLRIQAKPVRTISQARHVVATACHVGRVAPITLTTPMGRQYTVALWIMTAEWRFAEKPFFFDVRKHEKLETPGLKSVVEGVEGLRTPTGSRGGSRSHTPGGGASVTSQETSGLTAGTSPAPAQSSAPRRGRAGGMPRPPPALKPPARRPLARKGRT